MRYKILLATLLLWSCIELYSQDSVLTVSKLLKSTTIGGYIVPRAVWTDNEQSDNGTDFSVRFARVHIKGNILDFSFNLQMELAGRSGNKQEKGPRVIDAWVEWKKYDFLRLRFGQQKRTFTFENPYHPMNIGLGGIAQCINYLAGFNDRVGEHVCNGRDLGVAIYGDLIPMDSHKFLHYQAGVFSGQGVNHSDKNKRKDFMGGVYVEPIKDLSVGVFGWTGNYVDDEGETIDRKRWSAGLKYESDWSARAEYVGDKCADGWYALVGIPIINKCKLYGRWDVYRFDKSWATTKTNYGLAFNYSICQYLLMQITYSFTHDRTATDHNYNQIDVQTYVKF